jgi:GNAT superfamily N-acetyltransferase
VTATRPRLARRASRAGAIVVRPATPADAAVITELRLALLDEEREHPLFTDPPPDVSRRARALTDHQLDGQRETFFLALDEAVAVVGMLRCVEVRGSPLAGPPSFAMVTSAYVRPGHRRRGVLRALVAAADDWCRSRRLGEMRLHCGLTNGSGNASWDSLGFAPVEVLRRRYVPSR